MKEGIVLFAHGSREPSWAEPFEQIARAVASRCADVPVELAYLELMKPSLDEAIASLAAAGARRVRIVPVFLGAGGHVRQDIPALVAAANPPVAVTIDAPIGEQSQVIEAIAEGIASPR